MLDANRYQKYFHYVINNNNTEIDTPHAAMRILNELIEFLPNQINEVNSRIGSETLVTDKFEGFVGFTKDNAGTYIHEALQDIFYIQAILLKFPAVSSSTNEKIVSSLIGIHERCGEICGEIKKSRESQEKGQYDIRLQLALAHAEAQKIQKVRM